MMSVALKVLQCIRAHGASGRRHIVPEKRSETKVRLLWTGRPLSVDYCRRNGLLSKIERGRA